MNADMLFLVIVHIIVLAIFVARVFRVRYRQGDDKWLPRELRNAELVYAERFFRSGGDVPISAKCDRGYRTTQGEIVLVELKTRKLNRVYPSDIIELSAQRFAIQSNSVDRVADYGFVLIQQEGNSRPTLRRVRLLSNADVIALAVRRAEILSGNAFPRYACSKKFCGKCSFKKVCNEREIL